MKPTCMFIHCLLSFEHIGAEKKHKMPDKKTNVNTAYHEAGHALAAYYTRGANGLQPMFYTLPLIV